MRLGLPCCVEVIPYRWIRPRWTIRCKLSGIRNPTGFALFQINSFFQSNPQRRFSPLPIVLPYHHRESAALPFHQERLMERTSTDGQSEGYSCRSFQKTVAIRPVRFGIWLTVCSQYRIIVFLSEWARSRSFRKAQQILVIWRDWYFVIVRTIYLFQINVVTKQARPNTSSHSTFRYCASLSSIVIHSEPSSASNRRIISSRSRISPSQMECSNPSSYCLNALPVLYGGSINTHFTLPATPPRAPSTPTGCPRRSAGCRRCRSPSRAAWRGTTCPALRAGCAAPAWGAFPCRSIASSWCLARQVVEQALARIGIRRSVDIAQSG